MFSIKLANNVVQQRILIEPKNSSKSDYVCQNLRFWTMLSSFKTPFVKDFTNFVTRILMHFNS